MDLDFYNHISYPNHPIVLSQNNDAKIFLFNSFGVSYPRPAMSLAKSATSAQSTRNGFCAGIARGPKSFAFFARIVRKIFPDQNSHNILNT